MSLKEEAERILRHEQQVKDAAERTAIYYRKLCEEIPTWWSRDPQIAYELTLPVKVPSELQALLQEFMEAWPDNAWNVLPAKADPSKAVCGWIVNKLDNELRAQYKDDFKYCSKVQLSDGSIHVIECPGINLYKCMGQEYELVTGGLLGMLMGGKMPKNNGWKNQGGKLF